MTEHRTTTAGPADQWRPDEAHPRHARIAKICMGAEFFLLGVIAALITNNRPYPALAAMGIMWALHTVSFYHIGAQVTLVRMSRTVRR